MKLYTADCRENKTNTKYPNRTPITSLDDLRAATKRDHIAPAMRGAHRADHDFLQADCIMLDLDNTHSDDQEHWKTTDDIAETFQDVAFYYIYSRNHLKVKTKTAPDGTVTKFEPRPKYHCYFPLSRTYTSFSEYEAMMLKAAGMFPFFDLSAAKPAQFFYGVEDPTGGEESGNIYLDKFLEEVPAEDVAAAVKDFVDKVSDGTYKQNTEAQKKETQKAISRLYGYLGIQEPTQQPDLTASIMGDQDIQLAASHNSLDYSKLGLEIAQAEQKQSLQWLQAWAKQHDITLGRTYKIKTPKHPDAICICVSCPWENEHSMVGADNEAVIIIELGGKIGFLCRHSHGVLYSWKDYREFYEKRDAFKLPQEAPAAATDPATQDAGQETEPAPLPGLLTYNDAVNIFKTADDRYIELKSFPNFSATAKIKMHDTIVLAADTGAGKSSLAINFLNDLNADYPCIYINLEMDTITILRRLAAIYSGMELDRIEGYKNDENTAAAVNVTLQAITSRQPLQVIKGAYMLQQIKAIVERSTAGREDPTIVIIDHSLLVDTQERTGSRYDRFTQVSEGLRRMALDNNIIVFVLLQQSRAGKANEEERPHNSSLKESGSWENDATHICFLWYDPTDRKKKLLLTKNRSGSVGEFPLNYWKKTQTYTEEAGAQDVQEIGGDRPQKQTKREKQKQKLLDAYDLAYLQTFGKPTLQAIAEAADVTTSTIRSWLKEYGGFMVDGKAIDPAGIDAIVEEQEFIKLTPADNTPFDTTDTTSVHKTPKAGRRR